MEHPAAEAYQPFLIESLRDPGEAAAYLNAVLEAGDAELFILALQNVAEAQGGLHELSRKIHFIAA